ncbi:MAG: thioredoxin domain-containing protein, partial [Elusimicrobia bacterium]|nr:thioredoxin domain-containing protein [Elusimicrobiota bacterium]
ENSWSETLWVSDDGKHYLLGGFKDLSVHPDQERLAKMDLSGSPARGPKDAKVTVVQYTDFQCPFCSKGYELMRDGIMKEFAGKVRWVYKSLPLTSIHPWAEPAALAAECAKLQGTDMFWTLHDKLFENQREVTLENLDEKAAGYLKGAKADLKKFEACTEAKKTMAAVARDSAEADALGISGTPAFVVNGHFVSGADYGTIKRVVEESLKGKHGKS